MARLTIANVNKALRAAGFDAELVRGDGYFWFDGLGHNGGFFNVANGVHHVQARVLPG